jgi:type I restriction enzyme S subunit
MSSEWKVFQASKVCGKHKSAMSTGPFGSAISSRFFVNSGVPVIRGGNLSQDVGTRLSHEDLVFITEDKAREFERSTVKHGDLIFTCWGTIDQVGLIDERSHYEEYVISNKQMKMTPDPAIADSRFLYYQFSSPKIRSWIIDNGIGSSVPGFNLGMLKSIELNIPPLPGQKAIAHILGTLDDKIELNRKTNETLEAMAKALFKAWFVDFDPVKTKAEGRPTGLPAEISDLFPDSFEDSELREIPSGWQCCQFTQLVDVISGGTPKTSVDEYWNGSIPWFSVVDAPSGADCWVIQTEKSITHLGLDNCSSKLLPIGTTIISARGTVGKVCLTSRDMAMNQSCYGLRSKVAHGEFFCFYLTKSLVEILEARAHGSVFSTITRDTLDGVSTISPPLEVIQSFNSIAGALLGKIKNNLEESRILGNQRDALLPKLISGEIRIPDAEKLLEEVGI